MARKLNAVLVLVGLCAAQAADNEKIKEATEKIRQVIEKRKGSSNNTYVTATGSNTVHRRSMMGHADGGGGDHDNLDFSYLEKTGPAGAGLDGYVGEYMPRAMPTVQTNDQIGAVYEGMSNPGVTCETMKLLGLCDALNMLDMGIKLMCPLSCGIEEEEFCPGVDDDNVMYNYMINFFPSMSDENFEMYFGGGCQQAVATFGQSIETIVYPNGAAFGFCDEPVVAAACHVACNTNCWAWPPTPSTRVHLPGCNQVLSVPTRTHKRSRSVFGDSGSSSTCPP